jgi:DNA polymerase-3 subunit epsilon
MKNLKAVREARNLISTDFVVLDTETTGLNESDEIIEITIIDQEGSVLLSQRIKPEKEITDKASEINGITMKDLENCPNFAEAWASIRPLIAGKVIAAYNSGFDKRMLENCIAHYNVDSDKYQWQCIMNITTIFFGRKMKLVDACKKCGIQIDPDHSSNNDALASLYLIKYIANQTIPAIGSPEWEKITNEFLEVKELEKKYKKQLDERRDAILAIMGDEETANGSNHIFTITEGSSTKLDSKELCRDNPGLDLKKYKKTTTYKKLGTSKQSKETNKLAA